MFLSDLPILFAHEMNMHDVWMRQKAPKLKCPELTRVFVKLQVYFSAELNNKRKRILGIYLIPFGAPWHLYAFFLLFYNVFIIIIIIDLYKNIYHIWIMCRSFWFDREDELVLKSLLIYIIFFFIIFGSCVQVLVFCFVKMNYV